ncbi:MAG: biopolymer transporter ExbD [Pseudomonadota bacterium]
MKLQDRSRENLDINLTPLIDVVFLLLIFFMVTTTFERNARLKIDLPEASQDAVAEVSAPLEIAVSEEGRIYVNGNEVLSTDADALRAAIADAAGDDREQQVTIRADARTAHQHVVTVMDAVGRLGFANLTIATTPAEG